jgi:hypothetical protein
MVDYGKKRLIHPTLYWQELKDPDVFCRLSGGSIQLKNGLPNVAWKYI